MDEVGCTRLAAKVIIHCLLDIRQGDMLAEQWLLSSRQADIFLSSLNLDHLDRQKVIELAKTGKGKLALAGNRWK